MAATKRDAIRDAALALFAEKGVDATSTREIAERADTAEGNIYRHFKGKDDLVRSLFEECARQFHEVLTRTAESASEPRERLRRLVEGIFAFADEHPQAFAYLLSIHQNVLQRIELEREPLPMQLFTETLRAGIEAGQFRAVPPVLATGWIVGMTQRAIVLHRSGLPSMPLPDVMETTTDAALRLLAPGTSTEHAD